MISLCLSASLVLLAGDFDPDLLAGMHARAIGPAGMSGRVAAIAAVESNPNVIYVGAATGGLWKSVDGGMTWQPLFDEQPVAAIGAIAIDPRSPDVIWVGTGEGNTRNSASVGNGMYKSLDGGRTWQHLGLDQSERIHRICLDPHDPNKAYVAALGPTWGDGSQRGVFKTEDGGATWQRVLSVDERTGCADLVMDPANPLKLFAAMWEHRRSPHFFKSGGPGSGLFVTRDGGKSWQRLGATEGLPAGELGRMGLAIAPSNPNIVYALVEATQSALVRSDDGGLSFHTVNAQNGVAPRPFYFADIRVDPANPERVYSLHFIVTVSNDGGRSFAPLMRTSIHPDHHALWIDAKNPELLIDGNDGGVAISQNRGQSFRFVRNLPFAQFYHVAVDMDVPYHVYGGMQDNGSWRGPNTVWESTWIRNHHWQEVGFGDGFATVPMADDSLAGYAMSQGGELMRFNVRTGERKSIRPDGPDGVKLRFNWNAGIALNPFDANAVYYGSQFLHRSTDRGDSWEIVSPDLTTNNPEWQKQSESGGLTPDATGAENYTTIMTIAPSPLDRNVIWVGSDDGRIHVTQDGGKLWTSVEHNVLQVPANTWIPHIEASRFDAATAFVVFDDHRRSNGATYVYRTMDYGKTWSSLVTPELRGYAHVIVQDPVQQHLLYLGTEFGLFITIDGGHRWFRWRYGLPTVAVLGLVVHPRDHDLVIATHGRAAYVLDDLRPLRELSADTLAKTLHLFEVPPAQQYQVADASEARFPGSEEFYGENRPYGALITFAINDPTLPHPDPAKEKLRATVPTAPQPDAKPEAKKQPPPGFAEVSIASASGELIRTLKMSVHQGVNRIAWGLDRKGFRYPGSPKSEDDVPGGPEVAAGTYRLTLRYRDQELSSDLRVLPDPRTQIGSDARTAKINALVRAGALQETIAEALQRIQRTRADIDTIIAKASELKDPKVETDNPHQKLIDAGNELKKNLTDVEKKLWTLPDSKGFAGGDTVLSKIGDAAGSLGSSFDAPTPSQLVFLRQAEAAVRDVMPAVNKALVEDVQAFRTKVDELHIRLLPELLPLSLP